MKKTALLVLDFINDIVHPEGKIAGSANFIKEHHVFEKANKVIAFARQHTIPIVFVKVGFSQGHAECPENSPIFGGAKKLQALQLNTWGTEFYAGIDVQPQDLMMVKHRVSAFYGTALEAFLRANKIEDLIIIGVSTDMAVQTTAREAHDRDYQVTIVADACAAGNQENHDDALRLVGRVAKVVASDQLDKILS